MTDDILHHLSLTHFATEQAAHPTPQCCWHLQQALQDFGHSNMFATKGPKTSNVRWGFLNHSKSQGCRVSSLHSIDVLRWLCQQTIVSAPSSFIGICQLANNSHMTQERSSATCQLNTNCSGSG